MQKFPDLADNFATTNLEAIKEFIKERLNLPKEKADILIFVLVVAEEIGAKYIVPTNIAMVYGILDKGEI